MKQYITRKEVARRFNTVIFCDAISSIADSCGICPEYYNAGGYGWNWDLYQLDGFAIVGGYRSFPKCTHRIDPRDHAKILSYLKGLKTQRGRIAAAARLIKQFAKP